MTIVRNISWNELQLVIFDVDGTLYEQSKLRKRMFFRLISHYIVRPWKYRELLILYHFRKEREKRAGYSGNNLEDEQYEWCAAILKEEKDEIKRVVDKWIFVAPNRYLKKYMYPGVSDFFLHLERHGIKTAVYSDYDAHNKLSQMQINTNFIISSTDKRVNSFKPLPSGLLVVLSEMQITNRNNCLFIGDRAELDGVCAKHAHIPFLLVDKNNPDFYIELSNNLIQSRN